MLGVIVDALDAPHVRCRSLDSFGKTSDGAIASVLEDVPIMAMVGCCCKLPWALKIKPSSDDLLWLCLVQPH